MARKRNFIFTNKRHSEKAIMGTILGVISMVSLVIVVFLAYQKQGDVPVGYGMTGLLATIFSIIGLVLGGLTVRETDNYVFFSWMALILNGIVLTAIGILLYAGV